MSSLVSVRRVRRSGWSGLCRKGEGGGHKKSFAHSERVNEQQTGGCTKLSHLSRAYQAPPDLPDLSEKKLITRSNQRESE